MRRAAVLTLAAALLSAAPASGAGAIGGVVTAVTQPVCVLALDGGGTTVAQAETATDGSYHVAVAAGSWVVEFLPRNGCDGAATSEAFQFYPAKPTRQTATPVTVADGATTPGIDAQLRPASAMSGRVADDGGHALAGVCVVLTDAAGEPVLRQTTDDGGAYAFGQLPANDYRVGFVDDGCVGAPPRYAPQWWAGATTLSAATPIALGEFDARDGIDAVLHPQTAATPAAAGPSSAAVAGAPTPGPFTATGARRSALALLATRTRGYRLDARRRLRLPLSCDRDGLPCTGRLTLSDPRRPGLVLGRAAVALPADGRVHTLLVRIHGRPRRRLRLVVRSGSTDLLRSIVPLRR